MRYLIILAALAARMFAQQVDHYVATAATTALTIQQPCEPPGTTGQAACTPSVSARQISFGDSQTAGASVYCATASTATLSWNGTAATSTAGSELKVTGTVNPSGVTIWTASNVGAGVTGPVFQVPAGTTQPISLQWFHLGTQGTGTNITITTSNSCTITFAYSAI
jgi:hypothetical protein